MLVGRLQQITSVAEKSLASQNVSDYEELERHIDGLTSLTREALHTNFRDVYEVIASKLATNQTLSEQELHALRMLIVGEAEYYVRYENNFTDWTNELQRLTEEMARLQTKSTYTVDDILHIQALVHDAARVTADIIFYLRERDRLQRFEMSVKDGIDDETGKLLAGMVREMMQ
jgi:hypothetical protein